MLTPGTPPFNEMLLSTVDWMSWSCERPCESRPEPIPMIETVPLSEAPRPTANENVLELTLSEAVASTWTLPTALTFELPLMWASTVLVTSMTSTPAPTPTTPPPRLPMMSLTPAVSVAWTSTLWPDAS
ncbi:MAG: hypothetical protein ABSH35_27660 [Isosphaeraceae bacterium]|jgi:hypothetical protein